MTEEIVEERCQVCGKLKSECEDWNPYYHACEECL